MGDHSSVAGVMIRISVISALNLVEVLGDDCLIDLDKIYHGEQ